jgi:hypothetical protein
MNKHRLLSLLAFALLTGGLVGCGENDIPENPSWARDIQPLMEAHCIRCHGGGGMMNGDPDVPPNKIPNCGSPVDGGAYTCKPLLGNFTTEAGLMTYAKIGVVQMKKYLAYPMPPPPSEPLTDYEYNLLLAWIANPLP